jgi:hypothetical protein
LTIEPCSGAWQPLRQQDKPFGPIKQRPAYWEAKNHA